MNFLGQLTQPKIQSNQINTVDLNKKGFVLKVPKLTADLMRVNDSQGKNAVMLPMNGEVGTKLSLLA